MLVKAAPVILIPFIVLAVPTDDKVLMVLENILIPEEVFEQVMPFTFPPVPLEISEFIVFELIDNDVAAFADALIESPVIAPCPLIFVIVLLLIVWEPV